MKSSAVENEMGELGGFKYLLPVPFQAGGKVLEHPSVILARSLARLLACRWPRSGSFLQT